MFRNLIKQFLFSTIIVVLLTFSASAVSISDPIPRNAKVQLSYISGKIVSWKVTYSDGTDCLFSTNQGSVPARVLRLIAKEEYEKLELQKQGVYFIDPPKMYTGYRPKEIFWWDTGASAPARNSQNSTVNNVKRINYEPVAQDDSIVSEPTEAYKRARVEPNGTVMIAPTGECYHRKEGCRTVRNENKVITIQQAKSLGYRACEVCNPPRNEENFESR